MKNKSGTITNTTGKVDYIQFDVNARKGALKRPFVLLELYKEALQPILDQEYDIYLKSLPEGSPTPNPIAYRNSRLSAHWNSAPPEVAEAVEEEIRQRKQAAAEKTGRNAEAPWRMDLSLVISEEERLKRAMLQQVWVIPYTNRFVVTHSILSKIDALLRSMDRVSKAIAEECGAVVMAMIGFCQPKEGGKHNIIEYVHSTPSRYHTNHLTN